jgi:hypothetical protein
MDKLDELITLSEAKEILGVSHAKMSRLIQKGTLAAIINPLDNREKLVRKADVLSLIPNRRRAA